MSSKSSTSRYSEILDLSSIDNIKLIAEYQNKYKEFNKLYMPIIDKFSDMDSLEISNLIRPLRNLLDSIKELGKKNNINPQSIRIHSHYQKLIDDFLGQHKFNCFSPVIDEVNKVQKAFTQLLEGNPEPLAKLDLNKIESEARDIAFKCEILYFVTTSMDSQITDALNQTFDSSDPSETTLCAGNCLSTQSDTI